MKDIQQIDLDFMAHPLVLLTQAVVKDGISVVFIDAERIFLMGMLGESGRKFVNNGCVFIFKRELAEWFIEQKIAKLASPMVMPEVIFIDGYCYRLEAA